jgi:hypothetical protein
MNTFRHHPDGYILINDKRIELDDFIKKHPDYELPIGYTGREYIQGRLHRLYTEKNEDYINVEWKDGDDYIKESSIEST